MMFNNFLKFTQKHLNILYENSWFLQNTDKLILLLILAVFVLSTCMSSDVIGFVALIVIFIMLIQVLVKPGENFTPNRFELWLLAYFMIVIVSLAGSTLFGLSLKGFMKTATYVGFYVSVVHFLKDNKRYIPHILATIGLCLSFESVVAFMQNFSKVSEISTWQDVSKLNPEQIMTRVYGTLQPLNPNLLGGYFVAGIPALFGLTAYNAVEKKYKFAFVYLVASILCTIALFLTGCRGAYIACFVIFCGLFGICAKFLWHKYKTVFLSIIGSVVTLGTCALMASAALRARICSIFAMRQDSSNAFRFNVYQSSVQMFQDNWLLGIGVGNKNFREIYGLYMRTGFDALSSYNIFLETAVESGIFALITFVCFIVLMLKQGIEYILKSDNVNEIIFVSVAVVSILALMVHGLVDTVFFRPQIQFIFWTMAAILSSIVTKKQSCEC